MGDRLEPKTEDQGPLNVKEKAVQLLITQELEASGMRGAALSMEIIKAVRNGINLRDKVFTAEKPKENELLTAFKEALKNANYATQEVIAKAIAESGNRKTLLKALKLTEEGTIQDVQDALLNAIIESRDSEALLEALKIVKLTSQAATKLVEAIIELVDSGALFNVLEYVAGNDEIAVRHGKIKSDVFNALIGLWKNEPEQLLKILKLPNLIDSEITPIATIISESAEPGVIFEALKSLNSYTLESARLLANAITPEFVLKALKLNICNTRAGEILAAKVTDDIALRALKITPKSPAQEIIVKKIVGELYSLDLIAKAIEEVPMNSEIWRLLANGITDDDLNNMNSDEDTEPLMKKYVKFKIAVISQRIIRKAESVMKRTEGLEGDTDDN